MGFKDNLLGKAAVVALNNITLGDFAMKDYGKVTSISFNSSELVAKVTLSLKGESEAIDAECRYVFNDNDKSIALSEFSTSREWLTVLLNNFVSRKPFKVEEKIYVALRILV